MAPGGRRSAGQSGSASLIDSSATQSTTRDVRSRGLNKVLNDKIKVGMPRPKVVFSEGLARPLGPWREAFTREVGIVVRSFIPLSCHTWTNVDDDERTILYRHLTKHFDLDISDPHVIAIVNKMFAHRFKDYRCRLHLRYKKFGRRKAYKGLTVEAWNVVCNWFESEDFKKLSVQNSTNREKLPVNHRGGSKPYVFNLEDERDPITNEFPGMIEFYRRRHSNDVKGWIFPLSQENYERMIQMKSEETTEGSTPKTEDEIFRIVCGNRSGYALGLGHGKIPTSKSLHSYDRRYLEDSRQRAETAERRNEELASQLHEQGLQIEEINRWRRNMEAYMANLGLANMANLGLTNMANPGSFMSLLSGYNPDC